MSGIAKMFIEMLVVGVLSISLIKVIEFVFTK